ncbi:MAG: hypothetical protein Kow00109_22870 [Acidobacteriota bacterium]
MVRSLLALLLILFPGSAVAAGLEYSGYLKNFTLGARWPQQGFFFASGTRSLFGSLVRARLQVRWRLAGSTDFTVAYDLTPEWRSVGLPSPDDVGIASSRRSYRVRDLHDPWYSSSAGGSGDALLLRQNLDRAFLTLRLAGADLYVGRQAIAWGSAQWVNATDVLTPFAYSELDVEDRTGVDAVRLRVPLGDLAELDTGWVAGHDFAFRESAGFLRTRFNVADTDVALLGVVFREHGLLGFDVSRSLWGAGVYLEAGRFLPFAFARGSSSAPDFWRLSTGAVYTLPDGTTLSAEYHFSGIGAERREEYAAVLGREEVREAAIYLLGRHYAGLATSRQLTPLLSGGVGALVNLQDGSLLLAPNLEYSLSDNLYLGGGGYWSLGSAASDVGGAGDEFSYYPDFFFLSLRYYY